MCAQIVNHFTREPLPADQLADESLLIAGKTPGDEPRLTPEQMRSIRRQIAGQLWQRLAEYGEKKSPAALARSEAQESETPVSNYEKGSDMNNTTPNTPQYVGRAETAHATFVGVIVPEGDRWSPIVQAVANIREPLPDLETLTEFHSLQQLERVTHMAARGATTCKVADCPDFGKSIIEEQHLHRIALNSFGEFDPAITFDVVADEWTVDVMGMAREDVPPALVSDLVDALESAAAEAKRLNRLRELRAQIDAEAGA